MLPSLWAVQHELGYITPDGMSEVARVLGLAPSDVQAVSTFYSMYFNKPTGKHHVIVCANVSCGLRGADAIVEHIEKTLGCASGETSGDGEFTWEHTVECLGACGGAPSMQVDHHFHEDLTPNKVDEIFASMRGTSSAHKTADASGDAATGAVATATKKPVKRVTKSKATARPKPQAGDF